MRNANYNRIKAFTLIELSIVLVIIGLIVGGVLVGRDLIKAAEVRAQISQIEQFHQAVNTFRVKYNALPGDMDAATAARFGFTPRGAYAGQGDGNGVIGGVNVDGPGGGFGFVEGAGETVMFWLDLTSANGLNINLIPGSFSLASPTTTPPYPITGSMLDRYFPAAKLAQKNYIYVMSENSTNYFALSAPTTVSASACAFCMISNPATTVSQAYNIDKKIDDGNATAGSVMARYADIVTYPGTGIGWAPNAGSASASTCFDTTSNQYSVTQNNGAGVNCALSFKFQ